MDARLGNKTHCDICNSKAMRRARAKKEQKDAATASGEPTDVSQDESAPATAQPSPSTSGSTTQHHSTHDEGIHSQSIHTSIYIRIYIYPCPFECEKLDFSTSFFHLHGNIHHFI